MSDLIIRQDAIEALDAYIKLNKAPTHYENQFWIEGMEDAERIIKELPSAQKKGEWDVIDESEPRRYGCSVCKRLSWTETNYCPSCGADMRGGTAE